MGVLYVGHGQRTTPSGGVLSHYLQHFDGVLHVVLYVAFLRRMYNNGDIHCEKVINKAKVPYLPCIYQFALHVVFCFGCLDVFHIGWHFCTH